jgi:alpha-galactosidase
LFWTLTPLAIFLTIFFTSLKFDNDKINLSEKNQELKADTANLSTQLRTVLSQIEAIKSKQAVKALYRPKKSLQVK